MSGAGIDLAWWQIEQWTWCAPMTKDKRVPQGRHIGWGLRKRLHDYGINPDPSLPAELVRWGIKAGV